MYVCIHICIFIFWGFVNMGLHMAIHVVDQKKTADSCHCVAFTTHQSWGIYTTLTRTVYLW